MRAINEIFPPFAIIKVDCQKLGIEWSQEIRAWISHALPDRWIISDDKLRNIRTFLSDSTVTQR